MITTLPPSPPWTRVTEIRASDAPPSERVADAVKPEQPPAPALVPLPPSPPLTKHSLPFRRPPSLSEQGRRVSSAARTASGRRVSGALQYALQQDPAREVSDASSLDLAYYEQMREEVLEERSGQEDQPRWDSTMGFGGDLPDLTEEIDRVEDDEAWVAYVRQQLNTLFPDLIHADRDINNLPDLQPEGGDVSVSTIATSELPTPGADNSLEILGARVPNVRVEIGGLREEIERLRGVVTGLAEGLRAPSAETVTPEAVEGSASETVNIHDPSLSDAFLRVSGESEVC